MVTGKLVVIRINSTGAQYAYPESKYSELPTVSIDNGEPGHTNFERHELVSMERFGSAARIGTATLALNIAYDEIE